MGTHKSERLPERLRQLLTEAYLTNEKVYWQQREDLLRRLANKWVAVHNGQVVAVGEDMATVMDEVGETGTLRCLYRKGWWRIRHGFYNPAPQRDWVRLR